MKISEYHALERAEELHNVMEHTAGESDRGITLIVAVHVEACLRRTLEAVLIESKETEKLFDGPYAPFGSLSGKTQAAFVMGLITKWSGQPICDTPVKLLSLVPPLLIRNHSG